MGDGKLQSSKDQIEMLVWFHLGEDGFDFAIRPDDERGALSAHVGFAIHALFYPDAVGIDDGHVFIADQWEGELVLLDELFVTFDRVDADAKDARFFGDLLPSIPQCTSLLCATWSVIFWIEVKYYRLTFQIGELELLASFIVASDDWSLKCRGFAANL